MIVYGDGANLLHPNMLEDSKIVFIRWYGPRIDVLFLLITDQLRMLGGDHTPTLCKNEGEGISVNKSFRTIAKVTSVIPELRFRNQHCLSKKYIRLQASLWNVCHQDVSQYTGLIHIFGDMESKTTYLCSFVHLLYFSRSALCFQGERGGPEAMFGAPDWHEQRIQWTGEVRTSKDHSVLVHVDSTTEKIRAHITDHESIFSSCLRLQTLGETWEFDAIHGLIIAITARFW